MPGKSAPFYQSRISFFPCSHNGLALAVENVPGKKEAKTVAGAERGVQAAGHSRIP